MVSQKCVESFTSRGHLEDIQRTSPAFGASAIRKFKTRAERSSCRRLLSRSFFFLLGPAEWLIVSNAANERRASLGHVLRSAARARNMGVATPVLPFSNTLLQVSSVRRTSYSASDCECEVVGSKVFEGCKWEESTKRKIEERNDFEDVRGTVL